MHGNGTNPRCAVIVAALLGCGNYVPAFALGGVNHENSFLSVNDASASTAGLTTLRVEERTDGSASVALSFARPTQASFDLRLGLPLGADFFRGTPVDLPDDPASTAWVSYVARPGVRVSRSIVGATFRRDPSQRFRLTLTLGIPRPAQGAPLDARLSEVRTSSSGVVTGQFEVSCFARGGPPLSVSSDGGPAETTYALQYDPTVVTRFCRSTLMSLGLSDS